jgi:hypothetical protein
MHYHVRCMYGYVMRIRCKMVDCFYSATPFEVFIVDASTAVVSPLPSATLFASIRRSHRWVAASLFGSLFIVRFIQHALYKAIVPIA